MPVSMKQRFDAWRKALAKWIVRGLWPELPSYSTLRHAEIKDVATTTMSGGIALVYKKDGARKLVLLQAGPHYPSYQEEKPAFMVPGGFVNLTHTEGSAQVPSSHEPETVFAAAARELEEEMPLPDGLPLLVADLKRLQIVDNVAMRFKSGETRQVFGLVYELAADEVTKVEGYVQRINNDPAFRQAVMKQTINPATSKPEVCGIAIIDLNDAAEERVPLVHADQLSLFQKVQSYYRRIDDLSI